MNQIFEFVGRIVDRLLSGRGPLVLLKLFIAFLGAIPFKHSVEIIIDDKMKYWISQYTGYFQFGTVAITMLLVYLLIVTPIFFILKKVNIRLEKRVLAGFRLVGFISPRQYWIRWIQVVLFIPIFYVFLFGIFFAVNDTGPITTFIVTASFVLWLTPLGLMILLTIFNIVRYFIWRSKKSF